MNRQGRAVVIDFDHTAFDTDRFFWEGLRGALRECGVDERAWERAYEEVWPTGYTLTKHLSAVARLSGLELIQRRHMMLVVERRLTLARLWVYPDVAPFIRNCRQSGFSVYLLTFGARAWQRAKIAHTGLADQVDRVCYAPTQELKLRSGIDLWRRHWWTLFIDNDARFLDEVKRAAPFTPTCLISRVPSPASELTGARDLMRYREALKYARLKGRRRHMRISELREIRLPAPRQETSRA